MNPLPIQALLAGLGCACGAYTYNGWSGNYEERKRGNTESSSVGFAESYRWLTIRLLVLNRFRTTLG